MKRTLLLIFTFLAFVVGSFIWMVASFDSSLAQPLSGPLPGATHDVQWKIPT